MSDAPMQADSIDVQALVAKIRRDQAETDKFGAEQRKLTYEANKLLIDQRLAPYIALGGIVVATLGAAAAIASVLLHAH